MSCLNLRQLFLQPICLFFHCIDFVFFCCDFVIGLRNIFVSFDFYHLERVLQGIDFVILHVDN